MRTAYSSGRGYRVQQYRYPKQRHNNKIVLLLLLLFTAVVLFQADSSEYLLLRSQTSSPTVRIYKPKEIFWFSDRHPVRVRALLRYSSTEYVALVSVGGYSSFPRIISVA